MRGRLWIVIMALVGCGQIARSRGTSPSGDSGESSAIDGSSTDGDAGSTESADSMAEESEAEDAPGTADVEAVVEAAGDEVSPPVCPILEVPSTCESAHDDCGLMGDGFGNVLQCGACPAPFTCALGHCVWLDGGGPCARATCGDYAANCGSVGDGCGGVLDCGGCTSPAYCGGGGIHRCGGACGPEPVSHDMDCGVTVVCRPDR